MLCGRACSYDNTSAAGVLATVLEDAGVRPIVSAPVDVLGLGQVPPGGAACWSVRSALEHFLRGGSCRACDIAMQVGPYGTVLRGLDWADYHIGRR